MFGKMRTLKSEFWFCVLDWCFSLKRLDKCGNTGVSGGATPVFDEVIINMSRMNRIRKIDTVSGIAVADAGVILESLDNAVSKHGYMVPLDLGAKVW
jgi:hypothetical protein